jgi:hypothetical protein
LDRSLLLEFVCYVGAGLGLLTYGLSYLRDRTFARIFNSAGLFLTAGALILLPSALQIGVPGARVTEGWITAILLCLAMLTQGYAALRQRRPRTGLREREADRRGAQARTRASDRGEATDA